MGIEITAERLRPRRPATAGVPRIIDTAPPCAGHEAWP
jgi:hypothetical protein